MKQGMQAFRIHIAAKVHPPYNYGHLALFFEDLAGRFEGVY
jgi:hypothetical protein